MTTPEKRTASRPSAFTPLVYSIELPEPSGSGETLAVDVIAVALPTLLRDLGTVPGLPSEPDTEGGEVRNKNVAAILARVQEAIETEHRVLSRAMVSPKLAPLDGQGDDESIPLFAMSVGNRKHLLQRVLEVSGLNSGNTDNEDGAGRAARELSRFPGGDAEGMGDGSGPSRNVGSDAEPGA